MRARLEQFREKFYIANNMTLVVQGQETLDTLQSWVAETFSKIPSGSTPEWPRLQCEPFDDAKWNRHYGIVPVDDITELHMYWSLPPQGDYYASQPLYSISCLLGNEAEGSIMSYLKKQRWVTGLLASENEDFSTPSTNVFCIEIELTEKGLENMQGVILAVLQYLQMLQTTSLRQKLEETQHLLRLEYDYREKPDCQDNVIQLSKAMHKFKPEHYVNGDFLLHEMNEENIKSILSVMTIDKCCIVSACKNYKRMGLCHLKEKWFGTKYFVEDIPPEWISSFKSPSVNSKLYLSPPNPYACNDGSLISMTQQPPAVPNKLCEDDTSEFWYKPDYEFRLPKTYCCFMIYNTGKYDNLKENALIDLFRKVFLFEWSEELAPMIDAH